MPPRNLVKAPDLITALVGDGHSSTNSDAPVPWWSFAKTVLASAALVLVADGGLQLDAPLPGKPFTLRQVLQHRAGLRCYGGLAAYHAAVAAGGPPWPVDDLLRRAGAETLAYQPGHGWQYSNIGYLLVRKLIEDAAGAPLGPALDRLVFEPLGVGGVTVATSPADLQATAWGNPRCYHPGWVYQGLLVGTATAAAMFLHRLLAGELLPADLLGAMRDRYKVGGALPGRPWQAVYYGLGLCIGDGHPPGEYSGHTGGGPGSTSAVYQRAPDVPGEPAICTAAAFAAVDAPGMVESRALELATCLPGSRKA